MTSDDEQHDDEPDPRLLARWAGHAMRPYAGWIFIGAAALLILLGYLGVSRESIVGKQMPYLLSGGIGGVLLAVVGAYFLGTEELRKDSNRLDRLEQQVHDLHAALIARPDAPTAEQPSPNGDRQGVSSVVVVDSGETFHRSDCSLAAGKDSTQLTPAAASKRGLRPCPLCEPVPA
jgi:ABC-type nickel/cobalt efflux system permease component RcnA